MILSPRHNPLNLSIRVDGHNSGLRSRPVSPLPSARRALLSDQQTTTPNIESVLPKYGRGPSLRISRKLFRLSLWFIGTFVILYGSIKIVALKRSPVAISYDSTGGKAYEIVGEDQLPEHPTPFAVTDQRGRERWTVSIPPHRDFPLNPSEYREICMRAREVAEHVEDAKTGNTEHKHAAHHGYYYSDPNYMEIDDAQLHGLLPGAERKHDVWAEMLGADAVLESIAPGGKKKTCDKSLTYVLETDDAGLGATLMGLWMAYGLAQKEERAFFIDDTNWAYGSYQTYFKPPPKPSCLPPPKTQITPCPHQARHLLVSAATTPFTFGHGFNNYFENPRKMRVFRQEPIFALMRAGYEALFELSKEDAPYLASRIDELNSTIRGAGGVEIGIHVRHGDKHPMEFQYHESYLPLSKYADAAREILYAGFTDPDTGEEDFHGEMSSKFVLATDDPDVYSAIEMSHAVRAQERISLASKSSESKSKPVNGIDDRVGWEGGFFRNLFWSLGLPSTSAIRAIPEDSPPASYRKPTTRSSKSSRDTDKDEESEAIDAREHAIHPSKAALHLRELVGRAYLLDLAVVGQSDAIVCGVSSIGCRLLAVMMGWDDAIEGEMWKNVDGEFEWRGLDW